MFHSANQKTGFTTAFTKFTIQKGMFKWWLQGRDAEGCKRSTASRWAKSSRSFKAAEVRRTGSPGRTKPALLLAEYSAGTGTQCGSACRQLQTSRRVRWCSQIHCKSAGKGLPGVLIKSFSVAYLRSLFRLHSFGVNYQPVCRWKKPWLYHLFIFYNIRQGTEWVHFQHFMISPTLSSGHHLLLPFLCISSPLYFKVCQEPKR